MATTASGMRLSHLQRQRLKDAGAPIADMAAARTELRKIRETVEQLGTRRAKAQKQFDKDSMITGRYLSDESRAEARAKAIDALREVEADISFELSVLGVRAGSITRELADAAELPALSSLDPDVVRDASSMAPLVQVELTGLPLKTISARLRAAQIRANPAEVLAFTTAARALLAQRREAPQTGDDDSGFFAVQDLVQQAQATYRDTSFDGVLKFAGEVVSDVTAVDRQIAEDRSERGEATAYAFLEGLD